MTAASPGQRKALPLPKERAIAGCIFGTAVGDEWLSDLREWPRTRAWMAQLAARVAHQVERPDPAEAVPLNAIKVLLRNVLFIPLVLAHGFRRLLPPY